MPHVGIHRLRIFRIGFLILGTACLSAMAAEKHVFEAETAEPVGCVLQAADGAASGGYLTSLNDVGQGLKFSNMPAAGKLAIRYASIEVGTVSLSINDRPVGKVNVHSSGAVMGSFLYAIVEVEIPAGALLTISRAMGDVAVNIDQIIIGEGDLGLPPDIWNLPPLPVAAGPYSADWKAISRLYVVPPWWRQAKFGAWSHWSPQSMPEQGDWYARGMYIEGSRQYHYHLQHFGHPSEYGYKDICHNWVIDRWNPEELMDLYMEMGARYFIAMGVHHDNFDCWDSKYQPWNSFGSVPRWTLSGHGKRLHAGAACGSASVFIIRRLEHGVSL